MRNISLFLLFFMIGIAGMFVYKKYAVEQKTQVLQTPLAKTILFSLAVAPRNALKGKVLSFKEDVSIQKREATTSTRLREQALVLQGEEYWTHDDASLSITFPSFLDLTLQANTHISFIQTLPTRFVLSQESGEVLYTKSGATNPISIRIWPILIQQNSGILQTDIDSVTGLISLTVQDGSITVAFNNSENVSTVIPVTKGNTYTFDPEVREGVISTRDE